MSDQGRDIGKTTKILVKISKYIAPKTSHAIADVFYDVLKVIFYRLKRKAEFARRETLQVELRSAEVTGILRTIDYYHRSVETFQVDEQLSALFGSGRSEDDYLKYFESYLEGTIQDRYGRNILVDTDSVGFMYKDPAGKHTVDTRFFQPTRAKRQPWVRHLIRNSRCVMKKEIVGKETLVYVGKYVIELEDSHSITEPFFVFAKRNSKAKGAPYRFKTAYTICHPNQVLKNLETLIPAGK